MNTIKYNYTLGADKLLEPLLSVVGAVRFPGTPKARGEHGELRLPIRQDVSLRWSVYAWLKAVSTRWLQRLLTLLCLSY